MASVRSFFLIFIGILFFQMSVEADEAIPLHRQSADTCKLCHKEIYNAWRGSKHARSTPLKNPLMAASYGQLGLDGRKEAQVTKDGRYPLCLNCHAPNAAVDRKTRLDTIPAYAEGVNCVACHRLKSYLGSQKDAGEKPGIEAYEASDHLQGPQGFPALGRADEGDKGNPHLGHAIVFHGRAIPSLPLEANARQLKTADACLGCHQGRANVQGVSLCATDEEFAADKPNLDCRLCHMPLRDGIADHGMGLHQGQEGAFLSRLLLLELGLEPGDSMLKARVRLTSRLPHRLPAGTPFKGLLLQIQAYDSQGQMLWESRADDPRLRFVLELLESKDQTAMTQAAAKTGKDSRLQPFETRTLDIEIPKEAVALVRAQLRPLSLLPESLRNSQVPVQEISPEAGIIWVEARVPIGS